MNHRPINYTMQLLLLIVLKTAAFAQVDFHWAKGMGGNAALGYGNSIATNKEGSIYVAGKFKSTIDFDPSAGTANLSSAGDFDIFLARYDSSGNYLWAFGLGIPLADEATDIAIDASGNVLMTGSFIGPVDFDPDTGTAKPGGWNMNDIFIARYDANGKYLWSNTFLGSGYDYGYSITTDAQNNVYITGRFNKTVDLDASADTAYLNSFNGSIDIFLAKYDSSGNFIWANSMGGSLMDWGTSLTIDPAGNIIITGIFQDTADFDPSVSVSNLISNGMNDIFMAKYDSSGNLLWAKNMGGTGDDYGNSIATDNASNVIVAGRFSDMADFDPSSQVFNLVSAGSADLFVAKYDSSGNLLWVNGTGDTGWDNVSGAAIDNSGNVYATGTFSGTPDFDPSANTANLTASGQDIFIARYNAQGNYIWAKNFGISIATYALAADASRCLYLTGNFSLNANFDTSAAGTLSSAGNADIFIAKYQDATCISPAVPVLSASATAICPGDSCNLSVSSGLLHDAAGWYWYTAGCGGVPEGTGTGIGISPATTTTYFVRGEGNCVSAGICDSITITVNSVNDVSTSVTGTTISANAAGMTYQWVDCNNDFAAITNETNQSFTATANGSYAVIISNNGCSDTSDCVQITGLGLHEMMAANKAAIFPNPFRHTATVHLPLSLADNSIELTVCNLLGEKILQQVINPSVPQSAVIDRKRLPDGIYFYTISSQMEVVGSGKLVLQ